MVRTLNPRTKDEFKRMYERLAKERRDKEGSPRFTPPENYKQVDKDWQDEEL